MDMDRKVTMQDFIMPEFRGRDPEDYEFRCDGKIVRKDRWETGLRSIAFAMGFGGGDYEISDVVAAVKCMVERNRVWKIDPRDLEDL